MGVRLFVRGMGAFLITNDRSCSIRDLHMKLGERQALGAFLPFTDKIPSDSLG